MACSTITESRAFSLPASSQLKPEIDQPETKWVLVPLEKILKKKIEENLSASNKKVVFLDCNRIDMAWNLGILHNGFADHLDAVVRKVNEDAGNNNLIVFNSTGGSQVGWSLPERKDSVFAYFVWLEEPGRERRAMMGALFHSKELAKYVERAPMCSPRVCLSTLPRRARTNASSTAAAAEAGQDFKLVWTGAKPAAPIRRLPRPTVRRRLRETATGQGTSPESGHSQVDPAWADLAKLWQRHGSRWPGPGRKARRRGRPAAIQPPQLGSVSAKTCSVASNFSSLARLIGPRPTSFCRS